MKLGNLREPMLNTLVWNAPKTQKGLVTKIKGRNFRHKKVTVQWDDGSVSNFYWAEEKRDPKLLLVNESEVK